MQLSKTSCPYTLAEALTTLYKLTTMPADVLIETPTLTNTSLYTATTPSSIEVANSVQTQANLVCHKINQIYRI